MSPQDQYVLNMLLGKSREIAPEGMKRLSQSRMVPSWDVPGGESRVQCYKDKRASLVAQQGKSLPTTSRPGFESQVGKIPWRRKWTEFIILAWRIPCTEEPSGLQSMGLLELGMPQWLNHHKNNTAQEPAMLGLRNKVNWMWSKRTTVNIDILGIS